MRKLVVVGLLLLTVAGVVWGQNNVENNIVLGPLRVASNIGVTRRDTTVAVFVEGAKSVHWYFDSDDVDDIRDSTVTFQASMNCTTYSSILSHLVFTGSNLGLAADNQAGFGVGARQWGSIGMNKLVSIYPFDNTGTRTYDTGFPIKCMRCIVLWQSDPDTAWGGTLAPAGSGNANIRVRVVRPAGR